MTINDFNLLSCWSERLKVFVFLSRSLKSMSTLARVSLSIEPIPTLNDEIENRPPTIFEKVSKVSVLESDPVGHLVALVAADDKVLT